MNHCFKIFLCILVFYSGITKAQSSNDKVYDDHYTGCWRTNNVADGYLVTKADHTFQWIKPADTLWGSWQVKGVISLPKKTTAMIMKFSNGKKKRYEVGVSSLHAAIYLSSENTFRKVPCE